MITRAVGVKEDVEPEITTHKIRKNEAILLCTDGLTNLVDDQEILKAVENDTDFDAVQNLVSLAISRGGNDNITVVIIK